MVLGGGECGGIGFGYGCPVAGGRGAAGRGRGGLPLPDYGVAVYAVGLGDANGGGQQPHILAMQLVGGGQRGAHCGGAAGGGLVGGHQVYAEGGRGRRCGVGAGVGVAAVIGYAE